MGHFLQQINSPEKLAELNQLLAESGLSLELNSGSTPVFKRNGQAVDAELLGDYLQAVLQGHTAKLQELDKKLTAVTAAVSQLQTQADQEAAALNARVKEQTELIPVYKERIDDLKKISGQLDERLQDPILDEILPRELLDGIREEIQETLERAPAVIEQAENTLAQAEQSLIRGHLLAQLSQLLLQQAQDLQAQFGDLFKVSDQLNEALKSQLDAELQALVAKANEAQALLSQTAKPDTQQLEQATQKWLEEVLKTTDQLNTLLSEQQNTRQTERQQVSQQVEKIRRNAEYHLKQLGGFDTRRKESVDEILRKSIQNFQADRPFLARSIQKL
jgi:hypothetical protein